MVNPCVSDDVLICANMLEYFFMRVYFDISQNLSKTLYLIWMEYIWNIHSYTCSHVHALARMLKK
jgi:hypothetical protein